MTAPEQTNRTINALIQALPSIPHDNEGPIFAQPWQAEVFAMTLSLHEEGVFSWNEWAEQLHSSIQLAQQNGDPDLGDTYYNHWLDALENLIVSKQIGSTEQLSSLYTQWDTAAKNTAHGKPITLK